MSELNQILETVLWVVGMCAGAYTITRVVQSLTGKDGKDKE